MKGSVFALAAVAGTALANSHQHGLLHALMHKRDDTEAPSSTVEDSCAVTWTTWIGEPTLVEDPTSPATAGTAHSTSTSAAAVPSSSADTGSNFSEGGSGSRWSMSYSAYQGSSAAETSCKSASQVMDDVAQIAAKDFSVVRIYATDCSHLQNVGAAAKAHGLKMIPGIFIDSSGINDDTYDQLNDIVQYFDGDYGMVEMMIFGSETIFNEFVSASDLASFLSDARSTLRDAGYEGAVTTADTVSSIQDNAGTLCDAVDVVAANIYAFFNGEVQPSDAGNFVDGQFELLEGACPSKEVYNVETGWPCDGPAYMNAVPSPENQITAIKSLAASQYASKTSFFSFENDGWKDDGSPSVEMYWGCAQIFSG